MYYYNKFLISSTFISCCELVGKRSSKLYTEFVYLRRTGWTIFIKNIETGTIFVNIQSPDPYIAMKKFVHEVSFVFKDIILPDKYKKHENKYIYNLISIIDYIQKKQLDGFDELFLFFGSRKKIWCMKIFLNRYDKMPLYEFYSKNIEEVFDIKENIFNKQQKTGS